MSAGASIEALAWAANQRGVSYGELVAHLAPGEELEIEAQHKEYQEERKRRAAAILATAEKKKRRKRKKEE